MWLRSAAVILEEPGAARSGPAVAHASTKARANGAAPVRPRRQLFAVAAVGMAVACAAGLLRTASPSPPPATTPPLNSPEAEEAEPSSRVLRQRRAEDLVCSEEVEGEARNCSCCDECCEATLFEATAEIAVLRISLRDAQRALDARPDAGLPGGGADGSSDGSDWWDWAFSLSWWLLLGYAGVGLFAPRQRINGLV